MTDSSKALDMIRAVYEDGEAEINGRTYQLTKTTHKKRRKVFAFFSKFGRQIEKGDFSFLETPEFEEAEKVINTVVLFEGQMISRLETHWDLYPQDYMIFITTFLGAISYPFLSGIAGS
jgi:hypothetical protein